MFEQSKESIDAAISDVLSKPYLPLPLGLKAPALEGVMGELQRQGIPRIPPSCAWMRENGFGSYAWQGHETLIRRIFIFSLLFFVCLNKKSEGQ